MVLHTWDTELSVHPHVDCMVSGGGIKEIQRVAATRSDVKILFPVDAMKPVYKGIHLDRLPKLLRKGKLQTEGTTRKSH